MFLNYENDKDILLTSKKTKPTQSNDDVSDLDIDKQELEQDEHSFHKKMTEKITTKNKRVDRNGNLIEKNGKQRVTFIDKVQPVKFTEIIEIESFKDYNKMNVRPLKNNNSLNSCCSLF